MTDYTELIKALRYCAESGDFNCNKDCPMYPNYPKCLTKMDTDAAAAIEALQAEIRESMQKCAECGDRMVEPKRGKWIWIQKANGGQYKGCSVCHAPIPTDSMLDYLDDEDCYFCYSCGAKMTEVRE